MNDVNGFNDFLRVREISFLMFLRTEKHKSEIIFTRAHACKWFTSFTWV